MACQRDLKLYPEEIRTQVISSFLDAKSLNSFLQTSCFFSKETRSTLKHLYREDYKSLWTTKLLDLQCDARVVEEVIQHDLINNYSHVHEVIQQKTTEERQQLTAKDIFLLSGEQNAIDYANYLMPVFVG